MNSPISSSRFTRLARNWPVLLAGLAGVLLTIASYLAWQWQEQRQIAAHAHIDASEYSRALRDRMDAYIHLNRDIAGLFAASDSVEPHEFEAFVNTLQAHRTHPGLGYIGWLPRVPASRVPSFAVHGSPGGAAADYPLLYSVPFEESAQRLLGFDYAAIAGNREAMRKAADSGESVATARTPDLSEPGREDYVFVFTPVYAPAMPADSPAQRRDALTGYVLSAFRVDAMIEGITGPRFKQRFDLEIYDGALARERLLYDGDRQPHALEDRVALASYTETSDFAGRRWILHFQPKDIYVEHQASRHGWLVLLCGGLVSAFFAALTWKWLQQRRAQRMQSEHAQRFYAVFENHPSAVFSLDTQWRFLNANSQSLRQFETSRSKLIDSPLLKLVANEDVERVQGLLNEALSSVSVRFDCTLVTVTGKRIEASVVLIPVVAAGQVSSVLGIADNITERRQFEWQLAESKQMLQLVIDNIPQRVFWKDTELYYLGCNKAFSRDAGLDDPSQIVGKSDHDFPWKDEADAYRRDDLRTIQSGIAKINYEEAQHRQDGTLNWLRTSKIPLADASGRTIGVLAMYEDITERKLVEQRMEHMALYDGLTGLPNRSHFLARLEQAIATAKRQHSLLALMYFDIDKFKRINDTLGHDIGDQVIQAFATRVADAIRESDMVGRLGGDEFCLLMENLPNEQAPQKLAAKLIDLMRQPMRIGETVLQVGTSIGIAHYRPGTGIDELIRCADQAMYLAKQAGGNRFHVASADTQPA